jgi:hypothetical protein
MSVSEGLSIKERSELVAGALALTLTLTFCAQDWIRTSTPLQALRPEHSASTNFATWAVMVFVQGWQR